MRTLSTSAAAAVALLLAPASALAGGDAPTIGVNGLSGQGCPGTTTPATLTVNDDDVAPTSLLVSADLDGNGTFETASSSPPDSGGNVSFAVPGGRPRNLRFRVAEPGGQGGQSATTPAIPFGVAAPQAFAASTASPSQKPLRRQPVTFYASGGGACPVTASWDFGDGSPPQAVSLSGSAPVQHPYEGADRTYTATLSVDDGGGPVTRTVSVTTRPNQIPTAVLKTLRPDVLLGETTSFEAVQVTDLDGDVAAIDWDLDGNGSFDDAKGASVTFQALAAGQPKLRIRDDLGGERVLPVPTTVLGPAALAPAMRAGVVTGSYFSAEGGSLNTEKRIEMRQTGKVDGVRFGVPVTVTNLRGARVQVVVPGRLAQRLGLSPDGSDLVLAEGEASVPTAIAGGTLAVPVAATPAGTRLFARVRRLPVTLTVSGTDGFGRPVTSTSAVVLEEDKGSVSSRPPRPGSGGLPRTRRAAIRLRFGATRSVARLSPAPRARSRRPAR